LNNLLLVTGIGSSLKDVCMNLWHNLASFTVVWILHYNHSCGHALRISPMLCVMKFVMQFLAYLLFTHIYTLCAIMC